MQASKKSLTELLTDSEEVRDLLQLYGIEAPDSKQTKERLEQLVAQIGEDQLLASLFELASGFALMAQEVFDLALEANVGIQGQVLLPTQGAPLALSALDSGWACSSASPVNTDVNEPRICSDWSLEWNSGGARHVCVSKLSGGARANREVAEGVQRRTAT